MENAKKPKNGLLLKILVPVLILAAVLAIFLVKNAQDAKDQPESVAEGAAIANIQHCAPARVFEQTGAVVIGSGGLGIVRFRKSTYLWADNRIYTT